MDHQANLARGQQQVNNATMERLQARYGNRKLANQTIREQALSYCRTPEHRRLRAELIHRWKPWHKSTGPRTPVGKARVAMNAYRGGTRVLVRRLGRMIRNMAPNAQQVSPAETNPNLGLT
jgi:hypothetical protein